MLNQKYHLEKIKNMKHLVKYSLFESNTSDIVSKCELILIDLEDFGLRVDVNEYTKDLDIFITNNYEESAESQTQRDFLFPKIKEFEYSDIKYNIEELISFLSESYYLESIYNIIDYRPKLIYLQDLEKLKDFQRLEFRFKNKN
jgi:hypothetical protein